MRLSRLRRKPNLVAKAKFKVQKVDPFDLLQIKPALSTRWDKGKQLSPKQRKFLRDRDYDPDQFDYSKGSQLIGALIERNQKNLCTLPTVKLLKRYNIEAINYTRQQASKLIEAIKDNGWKKPWNLVLPEMEMSVAHESGFTRPILMNNSTCPLAVIQIFPKDSFLSFNPAEPLIRKQS